MKTLALAIICMTLTMFVTVWPLIEKLVRQ